MNHRQLRPNHPRSQQQRLLCGTHSGPCPLHDSLHITYSQPLHLSSARVYGSQTHDRTARGTKLMVANLGQLFQGLSAVRSNYLRSDLCGGGGAVSVPDAINRRDQRQILAVLHDVGVARLSLAVNASHHESILHQGYFSLRTCRHLVTVTVVPWPGPVTITNSSIKRRTPGKPKPKLPEVEKPSRSACRASAIPGPSSEATIIMPRLPFCATAFTLISPVLA